MSPLRTTAPAIMHVWISSPVRSKKPVLIKNTSQGVRGKRSERAFECERIQDVSDPGFTVEKRKVLRHESTLLSEPSQAALMRCTADSLICSLPSGSLHGCPQALPQVGAGPALLVHDAHPQCSEDTAPKRSSSSVVFQIRRHTEAASAQLSLLPPF